MKLQTKKKNFHRATMSNEWGHERFVHNSMVGYPTDWQAVPLSPLIFHYPYHCCCKATVAAPTAN